MQTLCREPIVALCQGRAGDESPPSKAPVSKHSGDSRPPLASVPGSLTAWSFVIVELGPVRFGRVVRLPIGTRPVRRAAWAGANEACKVEPTIGQAPVRGLREAVRLAQPRSLGAGVCALAQCRPGARHHARV